MRLVIWWVDEPDCHAIGEHLVSGFPKYMREQYRSRYGRAGRGRLWAEPDMDVSVDPWPTGPLAKRLEDCGGIVIHEKDARLVWGLPGILTDTKGKRLTRIS